ncbi:ABC transporter [Acuticoccus sediminis]|uniref:ABC transporter n=1 Tax=Acuticoccus sediminis TaxID=2184697 RepID=A0A8B2NZY1_9HYPH|nr:PotD/PotF family extracellular solute-binding protein [Acuticoccus sediminis]RAI01577.1 ABC transporter [Acuticoccus sediminis]
MINRRTVLRNGLLSTAALGLGTLPFARGVFAAEQEIVAVEWGGNYLAAVEAINGTQDAVDVTFDLHSGGAATVLAKIDAAWPERSFDAVAAFSPVFTSMIREGWCETIDPDEMPNLKDVPRALFMTDADGALKVVPRSITGQYWGYREDMAPFALENVEQLLDDRLRGQILFPSPIMNSNMQMVTIARALGGSVSDIEPAWDFVKELARKGNIGRVSTSDSETLNSLASGETSIAFSATTSFAEVAKVAPVKHLTKMPEDSGFVTALVMEGWAIPSNGRVDAAKEWVNLMMSPDNNGTMNEMIGTVPTNSKAAASEALAHITFTEDELAVHTLQPDWAYQAENMNEWATRWEREVAPLL